MKSLLTAICVSCLTTCWAEPCPFPGLKANSKFTTEAFAHRRSFREGDVVSFECFRGFYLIPDEPNFIICQNGSWTASPPRCVLRSDDDQLDVRYWNVDDQPWIRSKTCTYNVRSRLYLISAPLSHHQSISHVAFNTCGDWYDSSMLNVTMGDGSRCEEAANPTWMIHNCEYGDGQTLAKKILIHFDRQVKMKRILLFINEAKNCGLPPIPLGADVATNVISGQTTLVTYACHSLLSMDPTGPQESVCDPRTGDWSPLSRCTGYLHWEELDPLSNTTLNTEHLGSDSQTHQSMISSVTVTCVIVLIVLCILIRMTREIFIFWWSRTSSSQSRYHANQQFFSFDKTRIYKNVAVSNENDL